MDVGGERKDKHRNRQQCTLLCCWRPHFYCFRHSLATPSSSWDLHPRFAGLYHLKSAILQSRLHNFSISNLMKKIFNCWGLGQVFKGFQMIVYVKTSTFRHTYSATMRGSKPKEVYIPFIFIPSMPFRRT